MQANPRKTKKMSSWPGYWMIALLAWPIIGLPQELDSSDSGTGSSETVPETGSESTSKPLEPAKNVYQLLSEARVDASAVWLQAGEHQFLGFWQQDLSGQPLGAVLILHDEGATPLSPRHLLNLQKFLPVNGWATLSITMPALAQTQPPAREPTKADSVSSAQQAEDSQPNTNEQASEADQAAGNTTEEDSSDSVDETDVVFQDQEAKDIESTATDIDTEKAQAPQENYTPPPTVDEVESLALTRIDAGIKYLQEKGQYNIVVLGEGSGGLRALQYASEKQAQSPPAVKQQANTENKRAIIPRAIRAVVLLNLQNNYPGHQAESISLLPPLKQTPVLDIYTSTSRTYNSQARSRHQLARQQAFETFRQYRVISQSNETQSNEFRLTKAIRGFVERYAAGKKL